MENLHQKARAWIAPALAGPVATGIFVPDGGQTLAEYALILAFIAVVVIVAVAFLDTQISSIFTTIGSAV